MRVRGNKKIILILGLGLGIFGLAVSVLYFQVSSRPDVVAPQEPGTVKRPDGPDDKSGTDEAWAFNDGGSGNFGGNGLFNSTGFASVLGNAGFYSLEGLEFISPADVPEPQLPRFLIDEISERETILDDFQNGVADESLWKKSTGTQSADTTDYVLGNQSLKLTTLGNGARAQSRRSNISPAYDLTGKFLVIRCKINNLAHISANNEFGFRISSDNMGSDILFYRVAVNAGADDFAVNGEWFVYTLNLNNYNALSGTVDLSHINSIQITAQDDGTQPIDVWINSISVADIPPKAHISVTFDDGWGSQWDKALPYMAVKGMPATAYVIPDRVGATGYMSLDQIHAVHSTYGWDIASHGLYGLRDVKVGGGIDAVEDELKRIKQYGQDNNFNAANHFALPSGQRDTDIDRLTRKYFDSSRTIFQGIETGIPSEINRLRAWTVASYTTVASVQQLIDKSIVDNSWLVLVFHQIVDSNADVSTKYLTSDFQQIMDDITAHRDAGDLEVTTITQHLNSLGQ